MLQVLREVQNEAHKTHSSLSKMGEGFKELGKDVAGRLMGGLGFAGIIGVGATGLVKFFENSISAAEKFEKTEIRLNAVMEANGRQIGTLRNEYARFAEEMTNVTNLSKLETTNMLATAEAFGLTGKAAENAVREAAALSAITGHSAESMERVSIAVQEGNLKMAMGYGRLIPQLRGVRDETEFLQKYNKLVIAGNIAQGESAETLGHQWAKTGEEIEGVFAQFGRAFLSAGKWLMDQPGIGGLWDTVKLLGSETTSARSHMHDFTSSVGRDIEKDLSPENFRKQIERLEREREREAAKLKEKPWYKVTPADSSGEVDKGYARMIERLKDLRREAEKNDAETKAQQQLKQSAAYQADQWITQLDKEAKYAYLATEAERKRQEMIDRGLLKRPDGRAKLDRIDADQNVLDAAAAWNKLDSELDQTTRKFTEQVATRGMDEYEKAIHRANEELRRFIAQHGESNQEGVTAALSRTAYEIKKVYDASIEATRERIMRPEERLAREIAWINEQRRHGLKDEEAMRAIEEARLRILKEIAGITAQPLYGTGAFRAQQFKQFFNPLQPMPPGPQVGPMPRDVTQQIANRDIAGGGKPLAVGIGGAPFGEGKPKGSGRDAVSEERITAWTELARKAHEAQKDILDHIAKYTFELDNAKNDLRKAPTQAGRDRDKAEIARLEGLIKAWKEFLESAKKSEIDDMRRADEWRKQAEQKRQENLQDPLGGAKDGGAEDGGADKVVDAIKLLPELMKSLGTSVGFINIGGF